MDVGEGESECKMSTSVREMETGRQKGERDRKERNKQKWNNFGNALTNE